ncbi:MAG: 4-hydroxy-tetrahydrodipicolinate synthase [Pseudomonadota bacterium]
MSAMKQCIPKLSGYAPAIPTPFNADGSIDHVTFERFCDLQINHGAGALVVCGTTGEAPTLSTAEQDALVRIAVGVAARRVPVIAGAGSNSTAHAIELSQSAEAAGADAVLSIAPYYNKPTQAGLHAHFSAIAQSTGLPIVLYDVPSRTACGIADDTIFRLAELPQFIGLKDATGDVARPIRLRPHLPDHFRLLSGDDATAWVFIVQGGDGCISVTSNAAPGLCQSLFLACRQSDMERARQLALPVAQLTTALFSESNPAPLKYALHLLGLMSPKVRLPLVELTAANKAAVTAAVAHLCEAYSEYVINDCRKDSLRKDTCSTWPAPDRSA